MHRYDFRIGPAKKPLPAGRSRQRDRISPQNKTDYGGAISFEVRAAEEDPVISRFTDEEWWNLTALAHECGFDAGREHERLVYPGGSDTHELNDRVSRQLRTGVEAVLKQDVLPFATTWEADDGHIHFR